MISKFWLGKRCLRFFFSCREKVFQQNLYLKEEFALGHSLQGWPIVVKSEDAVNLKQVLTLYPQAETKKAKNTRVQRPHSHSLPSLYSLGSLARAVVQPRIKRDSPKPIELIPPGACHGLLAQVSLDSAMWTVHTNHPRCVTKPSKVCDWSN